MRVLFIGDVVGSGGCEFLASKMYFLKTSFSPDLIIANGENSADGNGITEFSANFLFDIGVDVLTGGNHTLRRKKIGEYLESSRNILRPANYLSNTYGHGWITLDFGKYFVSVINLQGEVFMDEIENPFEAADRILKEIPKGVILIDFHAEATSEKQALARYLDSRVSAVLGTHTHVQTADEQIFPGGTAYISDVGMTGSFNSVLGLKTDIAIARLKDKDTLKYENATGNYKINSVFLDIEPKTGKTVKIERLIIG